MNINGGISQPTGDGIYDIGYARLLTLLREAGCRFAGEEEEEESRTITSSTTSSSSDVSSAGASPGTGVYGSFYAGLLSEYPEGSRKVLDTIKGAVIVTNQQGVLYAVNAKCPHLGLPMKTGEITNGRSSQDTHLMVHNTPIL